MQETRTRPTRKESQEATRHRLVASATELFAKAGVAATSLNAVAEYAGFSRGAVHGNYDGKDALAAAVAESVVGALGPQLERVLAGPESSGDRLAAYIRTFLEYCADHPNAAGALIAVVEYFTRQRAQHYNERAAASLDDLVGLFDDGQKRGEMRAFDARTMAFAVRTVLDSAALRLANGWADAAELTTEITAMFIAATREEGTSA